MMKQQSKIKIKVIETHKIVRSTTIKMKLIRKKKCKQKTELDQRSEMKLMK